MYRNNSADQASEQVTVRLAAASDRAALARLAALDSGTAPEGPALLAESRLRILAALPLGSGRAIADPFEPTAELVALLELRRAQLSRAEGAPRRSPGALVRGVLGLAIPQGRTSS